MAELDSVRQMRNDVKQWLRDDEGLRTELFALTKEQLDARMRSLLKKWKQKLADEGTPEWEPIKPGVFVGQVQRAVIEVRREYEPTPPPETQTEAKRPEPTVSVEDITRKEAEAAAEMEKLRAGDKDAIQRWLTDRNEDQVGPGRVLEFRKHYRTLDELPRAKGVLEGKARRVTEEFLRYIGEWNDSPSTTK